MAFDAVGELAAQPGGQELSALVARAQRVDPEVLLGMGRGLAAMAEGVDGSLRSIGRHGDDIRAAWQGQGADALTGYLDDVGAAGARTLDITGHLRARLDGAGQELAGMRREVDGHMSRALDAARRARTEALADPARAPFADQLAARAMAEPTAAVRATLARAETLLGDAATALRELAGELSAFSRLPTPDARPIAPLAGPGSLGWAVAEPATTVPASSAGGGQGIDLAGGSGDFTDTSSLDSSGGCADSSDAGDSSSGDVGATGASADPDGAEDTDEGGFTGTSADIDDSGDDASASEASDSEDPDDDGFTGTSADLDDDGAAASSETPGSEDSGSDDDGFTGTSADLDDSGDDASASEASGSEDSGSDDDGFTGTSADLDEAGEASEPEASDTGKPGSNDDGFTGTSADLTDSGDSELDGGDAPDSEESETEDSPSSDDESTGTSADADDDPSVSDASDAGDPTGDADSSDADSRDADSSDADATDADAEDGAVTSASTDTGDTTGPAGDPTASPGGGPAGEVGDWIREAMAILQAEGVPVDKMDPDDIATIIDHESGGDPEAINNWDSNADKGTPSQGLMQTIGPTFDSYKLAGHGEITDPVDNIIAGVRYAIARYGSVSEVPGVEAVARGDSYVGY